MSTDSTRLSGLDLAFLALDRPTTPMHMAAVAVFGPPAPSAPEEVARLLAERAALIPRLRARPRPTSWPLGGAEWVAAPGFRAADHVRLHHLTGRGDPLADHVSAWSACPLDLRRPPWEAHVLSGLPGGGFAVLLKLHHALTDGMGAVEVAAGLFDGPGRAPGRGSGKAPDLGEELRAAVPAAASVLRAVRPPWSPPPLAAANSAGRRVAMLRLEAADLHRVRRARGGTLNDVVLAVVAGGLRSWLVETGRPVVRLRALVPVSTRARAGGGGNRLAGYLCALPVDEADPLVRLRLVREAMEANRRAGPTRGIGALLALGERVPPPLHRLGARLLAPAAPLLCDIAVTTVPFPPVPLGLGGAPLRAVHPIVPLAPGHPIGVAVSPYLDGVHIGLNADAAAAPDVDLLAQAVAKAAAALVERCG